MPKLYRPHVPISVRIAVAERQVTELSRLAAPVGPGHVRLRWLLDVVARKAGCAVEDLRLDHDPPLGARPRRRNGLGRTKYVPDANDPAHLHYRPHGPEHEGSHLIKTNVRGDHGQHPDRVLIKKARRAEASRSGETRRKASGFPKRTSGVKHSADSRVKPRPPKRKRRKPGLLPSLASRIKSGERQNAIGFGACPPDSPYVWPKRKFQSRRKP